MSVIAESKIGRFTYTLSLSNEPRQPRYKAYVHFTSEKDMEEYQRLYNHFISEGTIVRGDTIEEILDNTTRQMDMEKERGELYKLYYHMLCIIYNNTPRKLRKVYV